MALDDLYAIGVITALLVFSVGITLFTQRRKLLLGARGGSNGNSSVDDPDETTGNEKKEALKMTVTFSESGQQHPWDPAEESLLSFAESRGIDVNSQCRAGECGACRTRLISGEVEYRKPPDVNPGRGHCLLCVSVPKSDVNLSR